MAFWFKILAEKQHSHLTDCIADYCDYGIRLSIWALKAADVFTSFAAFYTDREGVRPLASYPRRFSGSFCATRAPLMDLFTHTTLSLVLMPAVTGSERAVSLAQRRSAL